MGQRATKPNDRPPKQDIRTYRDLIVWQKAIGLCVSVYHVTRQFPDEERFGLVSQARRAAASVPANIAEGYGRGGRAEYIRYLHIARGSLFELQSHMEVARQLAWVAAEALVDFNHRSEEVDRLLSGLLRSLKRKPD